MWTLQLHTCIYTQRSYNVRSAFINLWRVNKYLIDMTAFLIKNSMCYQQGLVRGTKVSDSLPRVPKSWLYGQRKWCCSQYSTRCSKQDSVSLDSRELSAFGSLSFALGLCCVLWGCLLIGIATSSRTSHWFLWTNEIVTIMCLSIILFSPPAPPVREGLFKMWTLKSSLGDGVLAGTVHAPHSCCSKHLFAVSALVTFCSCCQIFSNCNSKRLITWLNESWDLGTCCYTTCTHTGFFQPPCAA